MQGNNTPAPVHAKRIGHNAGVLSAGGSNRNACSLRLLKASLEAALEQQGLLGLRPEVGGEGVRDVLFFEDGFEARFRGFHAHLWSQAHALERLGPGLLAALKRLAVVMLDSVRARHVHVPPLVLAAVQITAMRACTVRGAHFDNPNHGNLVLSLTITGTGTVTLGASATQPPGVTHEESGTWYALSGVGLSDYTHAVSTCHEPRLSVTYRYVKRGT